MTHQEQVNALTDAIGEDFAKLLDRLTADAGKIVAERSMRLFGEVIDEAVNGALAGLLIGPAIAYAVKAGATEQGFVQLVRTLIRDTTNPPGAN